MHRVFTVAGAAAIVLGVSACSSYGRSSPMTPNTPSGPAADTVTISIVGMNGAQSFLPNPSTVPTGKRVVWHNLDSIAHRVVFDDGEEDTGNIAPGAFSAPTGLVEPGPYHCSIHPSMIGRADDDQ